MTDRESSKESSPNQGNLEAQNTGSSPKSSDTSEPDKVLLSVSILASVGLFLSLLLEFIHVKTFLLPAADSFCAVGQTFDCTVVAASPSAIFMGLPWALWGAVGFLAILTAALRRSGWLLLLSSGAAIVSLGLLLVSLLEVGSMCLLCEAVHLTSWVTFGLVIAKRKLLKDDLKEPAAIVSIFALPLGTAVALLLFLPTYWASFSYKAPPPFATGLTEEGHPWIGSENPTFTFHEFIDYNCPHCKIASAASLRLLAKHKDWRIVRRQQPRMRCRVGSDYACQQTRMALCAAEQGKFWRADRWLFAHANPRKNPDIPRMIQDLSLEDAKFKACYSRASTFEKANTEHIAAQKAKLVEVPGYLVDDKSYRAHEFGELLKSK